MREVLYPTLIRFRGDPDLARELAAAAKREHVTLSEFARRELRRAIIARGPVAPRDGGDDPGPFRPAPGLREAA